ncbi:hypothetical protein CRE_07170 [Caenorhabditis remanei]|uniref:Uncharacterized protein n=1 Tax=Caenorhabditis remanei TaxID=31234 RepID=E3NTE3_CAERE|nr:hypothetical protein CRE_07170 [Caenorhabditis remanei]
MFLLFVPVLVSGVSILTKTDPAIQYNQLNMPLETNLYTNLQGFNGEGEPEMKTFFKFDDSIVDEDTRVYVANRECVFDIIAPGDMLMQCRGRLHRIRDQSVQVLDSFSEHFTFDHVLKHVYVYRHGKILRLQPQLANKTVAVWCANNVRDFNVVSGLLTVLFNNGTIAHNNTVLAHVDPAAYTRLPIFAAPPPTHVASENKKHKHQHNVLVCDDLMNFFARDKKSLHLLNDIFCLYAHHLNCAVFNLVQSAFALPPITRNNSTYIILMRNLSDTAQVKNILVQQFGQKWRGAYEAYQDIMSRPYEAVLLNNDPMAHPSMRILSNFLEPYPVAHVPI